MVEPQPRRMAHQGGSMACSSSSRTNGPIPAAAVALIATTLLSCADAEVPAAKGCAPVETRAPNARDQRPAFAGQTRTCAVRSDVAFDVVVLAKGLEKPWAVEPLPNGDLLITEKPGRMRIVSAEGGDRRADRRRAGRRCTRPGRAARCGALARIRDRQHRLLELLGAAARAATRRASRAACSRPIVRGLRRCA